MGRTSEAQAELDRAIAAIDRELAADLELTGMFDMTKQAFLLEMGQWARHAPIIEREVPHLHRCLAELYGRIPEAESAMERRGPANTLRDADRDIVQRWEGDARAAQTLLQGDLDPLPEPTFERRSPVRRLIARLFGRSVRT